MAPLLRSGRLDSAAAFSLHQPTEYLLVAPVARFLDELSLLTSEQHGALLGTLALFSVAWAIWRVVTLPGASTRTVMGAAARALGTGLCFTLAPYLAGALIPRPMVSLQAAHRDDLLVDFHSHTSHSHDGRWRFGAEDNRAWHSEAGFHAAYVTDHQTIGAWQAVAALGPPSREARKLTRAGLVAGSRPPTSTILLPGIETVVPGAHVNLLGVQASHAPLFRHRRNLDTLAFAAAAPGQPLVLLTLPFALDRDPGKAPRLQAIELSNGSPKGLAFGRKHRARILALADSLRVPLVAASNLHGWGATAVAWTALRVPGWRSLEPNALDAEVRAALGAGPGGVAVIERAALPLGDTTIERALVLPRFAIHIGRILTPIERASFAAWTWVLWLLWRGRARRRLLPTTV